MVPPGVTVWEGNVRGSLAYLQGPPAAHTHQPCISPQSWEMWRRPSLGV